VTDDTEQYFGLLNKDGTPVHYNKVTPLMALCPDCTEKMMEQDGMMDHIDVSLQHGEAFGTC
jgi:hypothetical protein